MITPKRCCYEKYRESKQQKTQTTTKEKAGLRCPGFSQFRRRGEKSRGVSKVTEDLLEQLFNSSEKRLARTLLLLARFGAESQPQQVHPKISQEMLAEMVGTTRSRVNFFMNKFRKLGFIRYNGGLQVHSSLLSVVLHE